MKQKIIFFLWSKFPVGGSIYQFLSFAGYLAQTGKYDVYYVNTRFNKVEERYQNAGVTFCDPSDIGSTFFNDSLVFTPYNYLFYLFSKLERSCNARICLYFYHPEILKFLSSQILPYLRNDAELVGMIRQNNAYCFMDYSNYASVSRQVPLNLEKRYVPITLHFKPSSNVRKGLGNQADKKTFNIGWLGRLDGDKIYSVINVADNLMKVDTLDRINFHLIGDGNSRGRIQIDKYSPKIKFIFTSYLYDEPRDEYIRNNVDLMVAMGISAVDSVMLDVPTLIPLVSSKRFYSNFFIWVHKAKEYSLGSLLDDIENPSHSCLSLESAIDEIRDPLRRKDIVENGKVYCKEAFSIENNVEKLMSVLNLTTLTYDKAWSYSVVKKQLILYKLYHLVTHKTYPDFHLFIAKLSRFFGMTFMQKIRTVVQIVRQKF